MSDSNPLPSSPTSEGREEVTRLIETTGEGYDCRNIVGIFDVSSMKPADLECQRARRNREFVHAEDYDKLRASLTAAQAELTALRAEHERLKAEKATLLKAALYATNGWACYAKLDIEHDEIQRLHVLMRQFSDGAQ